MRNSVDIMDEKSVLKKRCLEIIDICKKEVREMTDEEKQEFEDDKAKIQALNEELEELKKRLEDYEKELPEDEEEEPQEEQEENKLNRNNTSMKKKQFRLLDAINAVVNNRNFTPEQEAVFAVGKEEARKAGISVSGQITLPVEARTVTVTGVDGEHDDVIDTDFQSIIDPLRANSVLQKAGAKWLTGCVNDIVYPILNKGVVAWKSEIAEADDFGSTFDSKVLKPKRLTATIALSKQLLVQDSIGIEEAIRRDLGNAIIDKLEATILGNGAASDDQPAGMFNGVTPTSVSTFANVCDLEATVEDANVNGQIVYIASNKAKAALRAMDKGGKHTQLVYEGGEVDGTPLYNTSNVDGKKYIVGDFGYLAVAQFGDIDLCVDVFSRAKYAEVLITITTFWDAVKLIDGAFAYGDLA